MKYGGFGRPSWQIRWEGGKLRWRRFEAEWTEVAEEDIEPETQQWLDFWQALDQSRIWDWNEVYYRVADRVDLQKGSSDDEEQQIKPDEVVSWSVTILLRDGRLIDSSGSNAVPGATRRSRKGRGQRRGGEPERKPEPAAAEETPEKPDEQKSDPSNVGIPDDTFDQFLTAVRKLIGGREFADQDTEETPDALATQYRTLTPKRKTRPDPFAEDELTATTKRKPRKRSRTGAKQSTSGRKRTTRGPEGRSEGKTSKRKRTRRPRGEKSEQGEKVGAENSSATGRRRRRRRRKPSGDSPAGESHVSQEKKTTPSSDKHDQASAGASPARKKRRRRRRRSGRGKGADSGNSSASGGNDSS